MPAFYIPLTVSDDSYATMRGYEEGDRTNRAVHHNYTAFAGAASNEEVVATKNGTFQPREFLNPLLSEHCFS